MQNSNQKCAGYIKYLDDAPWDETYIEDGPPRPIPCDNQTLNGWGPPEHQASSCCDELARFSVQFFDDGFSNLPGIVPKNDFYPDGGADQQYNTECAPYIDGLKATLCDPLQGNYIRSDPDDPDGTIFRICKSTCDLVFTQCEYLLLQSNITQNITSGTEFCLGSWAHWDPSFESCLDSEFQFDNPFGFKCQTKLKVQVVENDCLSMIIPSENDLKSYKEIGYPIDTCEETEKGLDGLQVGAIVGISVGVASVCIAGVFLYIWVRRRRREEEIA